MTFKYTYEARVTRHDRLLGAREVGDSVTVKLVAPDAATAMEMTFSALPTAPEPFAGSTYEWTLKLTRIDQLESEDQ